MGAGVPITFRSGSGNFVFNLDYYDYAAGAGYKAFYPMGTYNNGAAAYALTTNSSMYSSAQNFYAVNGSDIDFDMTFNNPATIAAADATITFQVYINGLDADAANIVWTVYHVSAAAAETSLGSATLAVSDGNPPQHKIHTVKIALTEHILAPGEKLRLNLAVTSTGGGGIDAVYFDPIGRLTSSDTDGMTISSKCTAMIPFKVDI